MIPRTRVPRLRGIVPAAVAATILALACAAAASASTISIRGVHRGGDSIVFPVRDIPWSDLGSARIALGRQSKHVNIKLLRVRARPDGVRISAEGLPRRGASRYTLDLSTVRNPPAPPLFIGDFESHNLRQWAKVVARHSRVTLVRSPVRQGRYAARFVVKPGDRPIKGLNTERSELAATPEEIDGLAGADVWYGWSTYFPHNFNPHPLTNNIFTQWHARGRPCLDDRPNVALGARVASSGRLRLVLKVRGAPLVHGGCGRAQHTLTQFLDILPMRRWNDFVMHVRWSRSSRVGFVELWLNGHKVLRRVHTATLYPDAAVNLQQGLYRGRREPGSRKTSVIYQDALRAGSSYAAVAPAP